MCMKTGERRVRLLFIAGIVVHAIKDKVAMRIRLMRKMEDGSVPSRVLRTPVSLRIIRGARSCDTDVFNFFIENSP